MMNDNNKLWPIFFDEVQAIQSLKNGVRIISCPHSKKVLFISHTKIN